MEGWSGLTRDKETLDSRENSANHLTGRLMKHDKVLDDRGQWGGPVISLNSSGEYFRPRIMQYNFEN